MTADAAPAAAAPAPARLLRFDRTERLVHWANAVLFLVLIATGASLKVAALSTVVGNRATVKAVHLYAGLLLPVPVVVALLLRAPGSMLRADLRRVNRWTPDDRAWWFPRMRRRVALGKFNPGQKSNVVFTGATIVVMLMTGSIMQWNDPFSDSWRTGATFVHDSTWLVCMAVIAGHLWFALRDRDALRSMWRGWVPAAWAARRCPRWHDEETTPAAPADA